MPEWVKIKGFDYSVSDKGDIKNNKTNRILKATISTSGYLFVQISDGKPHMKYVHRLVAESFIQNLNNLPQVDHIDGNKLNNSVTNLRWVTVSENRTSFGSEQRAKNRMREVVGINESGTKVVFESRKAVADRFKCHPAKVKYGHRYTRSAKKGWIFYKVEDIV